MAYDKKLLADARRALERDRAAVWTSWRSAAATFTRASRASVRSTASCPRPRRRCSRRQWNPAATRRRRSRSCATATCPCRRSAPACCAGSACPGDYLTDKPLCARCGDTGYNGSALCVCVKERYAQLLKEQLSAVLPIQDQNFSRFNMGYYSTRPDARLGVSPRENMEYNLDECKAYAANFGKDSPNLLLYGSTGLGKTFLSTCIAEAVSARGFSVAYDTAINIVSAYETIKFGNGDGAAAAERAARYERADLLIIDDMGTEMGTAFTVSALYNLINNRLMAKRPMIINTNLLPEALSEKYSPAVASRLLGEFMALRFFGDDIRLLKKRM